MGVDVINATRSCRRIHRTHATSAEGYCRPYIDLNVAGYLDRGADDDRHCSNFSGSRFQERSSLRRPSLRDGISPATLIMAGYDLSIFALLLATAVLILLRLKSGSRVETRHQDESCAEGPVSNRAG